jgi:MOSC domain-containing protein YiiM
MIRTSIYKTPVHGPVVLAGVNLEGDDQSDRSVHGGPDKAVYAYPAEHYAYWTEQLALPAQPGLMWGSFGENLTTDGLVEAEICIGDVLAVGSAVLAVTQPRLPCVKLALRHDRLDMVKRFEASGRCGFYLRVMREGMVEEGDRIEVIGRDEARWTVHDAFRLYLNDAPPALSVERAAHHPTLSTTWRDYFRKRLAQRAGRVAGSSMEME